MEQKVFICDCHSIEHQFVVEYFNDNNDHEVYVSIRLNSFGNVFQRLWRALKYVVKVSEAEYSEVILNEDKQKELIEFLQIYKKMKPYKPHPMSAEEG